MNQFLGQTNVEMAQWTKPPTEAAVKTSRQSFVPSAQDAASTARLIAIEEELTG
jgi:hypothetical protein